MAKRAAVILAAGQGTRMKSATPKLLHKVGGRTLLDRVIDTVVASGCERIVVVVSDRHSPGVRDLAVRRLGEGPSRPKLNPWARAMLCWRPKRPWLISMAMFW